MDKITSPYACTGVQRMTRKNPAAVTLGRKGGKARAKSMPPERRSEIARKAAAARWKKT